MGLLSAATRAELERLRDELPEVLDNWTTENGISKTELFDSADMSRQAFSKWRNGRACPNLRTLLKVDETMIFLTNLKPS